MKYNRNKAKKTIERMLFEESPKKPKHLFFFAFYVLEKLVCYLQKLSFISVLLSEHIHLHNEETCFSLFEWIHEEVCIGFFLCVFNVFLQFTWRRQICVPGCAGLGLSALSFWHAAHKTKYTHYLDKLRGHHCWKIVFLKTFKKNIFENPE